jgi:hypothetical protein
VLVHTWSLPSRNVRVRNGCLALAGPADGRGAPETDTPRPYHGRMSTTDPDQRARNISGLLRPISWPLGLIGLASAPVVAFLFAAGRLSVETLGGVIFGYAILAVATSMLVLFTAKHRHPLVIVAYSFAYVGGMVAILGSSATEPPVDTAGVLGAIIATSVVYGVTAVLVILYLVQRAAVKATAASGVDTTATITNAAVDGMVNFVQHQRLTLSFVDQGGTKRWLRIGRTGGGFSVGDTLPLRYNPDRPGDKRAIIVG